LIIVKTEAIDENDLMEIALSAGADDMQSTGEVHELTCDVSSYEKLKKTLEEKEIPIEIAEISMVPQSTVGVDDINLARKILKLMDDFEDHDDIQNAYANFDIPDEIISQIGA